MNLTIEHSRPETTTSLVSLAGKLVLGPESAELEAVVEAELAQGCRKLIFDLRGVTHIDSTGMGHFIDAYNKLHRAGGMVVLIGASGPVREQFRVTRLDTVFPFYESISEASRQS